MSLYMHLSLPKNERGLEEEMEKAGREGDCTIFYLVCMFKLKSCNLAQTGTEIKYKSGLNSQTPNWPKLLRFQK